jgi:hypothetical protein
MLRTMTAIACLVAAPACGSVSPADPDAGPSFDATSEPDASGSPDLDAAPDRPDAGETPASVEIDPQAFDFGSVALADQTVFAALTVTNDGASPSGELAVVVVGSDASSFSVNANDCAGIALDPYSSCTVYASFAPEQYGSLGATVQVVANPGGVAVSQLSGSGVNPPELQIDPPDIHFGGVALGGQISQTTTVTNIGDLPSGAMQTTLDGDVPQFSIGDDECNGQPLAPGSSCEIEMIFAPGDPGSWFAELQVSTSDSAASAFLFGEAIESALLHVPYPTATGALVPVGEGSATTFEVNNAGTLDTGTIDVSLAGDAAFSIGEDSCSGTSLASGDLCYVTLYFFPTEIGTQSATATISASPGGTATASVTADGVNP